MKQRWVVLADIHGNLPALEAVLAHAVGWGEARVVNLGDCLYGPLWPRETFELLCRLDAVTVSGNEDRELVESWENQSFRSEAVRFSAVAAGADGLSWLSGLPLTVRLKEGLFLCHGTPLDDRAYLLEEVSGGWARVRPAREIATDLEGVSSPVILCGHSHLPRVATLADGRLVVNPGSVGLPAYDDDNPPHVMEACSPHAAYALLEKFASGWAVGLFRVPYDHAAAAARALGNSRPDWAAALNTGRVARSESCRPEGIHPAAGRK